MCSQNDLIDVTCQNLDLTSALRFTGASAGLQTRDVSKPRNSSIKPLQKHARGSCEATACNLTRSLLCRVRTPVLRVAHVGVATCRFLASLCLSLHPSIHPSIGDIERVDAHASVVHIQGWVAGVSNNAARLKLGCFTLCSRMPCQTSQLGRQPNP